MKINMGTQTEETRIEIIPLIDVIFCILTFFILAAVGLTRQSGINVDLPQASSGSTQMREMLIVSLDPIGQLYVDQQPVSEQELIRELLNYQINSPEGLVVLYASRSSSYNEVVEVLDLLRSAGSDRVALATLPAGVRSSTEMDLEDLLNQEFENVTPLDPNQVAPGQGLPSQQPGNLPTVDPDPLDRLAPLPTPPSDRSSSPTQPPSGQPSPSGQNPSAGKTP